MKATGIVRRIDDLGRVVIPRELRKTLNIREGDPLELFITNDGYVCFKKYNEPINRFVDACKPVLDMAKSQGIAIDLYDDELRLTPSKSAPWHLNELGEEATLIGRFDDREYFLYMRGGEPIHEDIAAVYKGIIRRIANDCLI